jgi:F-type H+-transporting ATPase subunit delta
MSRVSDRYAKALIDLSQSQGQLEEVYADIQLFSEVVSNRDFKNMLESPIIKADKKQSIFKAVFDGKLQPMTAAFFDLVLKKGRGVDLVGIVDAFVQKYKLSKNIRTVRLTTATKASAETVEAIKAKLMQDGIADSSIDLETVTDAEIIGGFVLEFEGKLYDASIANRLSALKKEFSKNDYIKKL